MLYLLRYGELALKSSSVRRRMETILVQQIRRAFSEENVPVTVRTSFGRIFLDTPRPADRIIGRVFGIVSFSPVLACPPTLADLCTNAVALLKGRTFRTFAVDARRAGEHTFSSHDILVAVGDAIRLGLQKKVNLSHPDLTLFIEAREKEAYLFTDTHPGLGGYPLGSQGRVACEIRSPRDELACWLMMRKGCTPILLGSSPLLEKWAGRELPPSTLEEAKKDGALALVSSRLRARDGLPVYTPLLGMPAADVRAFTKIMRSR